jgi:hypothetical protein
VLSTGRTISAGHGSVSLAERPAEMVVPALSEERKIVTVAARSLRIVQPTDV